jgi:hypothetical protein
MASISDSRKKRGRPKTTGEGQLVGVRILPDLLAQLDAWIAARSHPKPSRPEAIRRLVELGLTLKPNGRRSIEVEDLNAENDG